MKAILFDYNGVIVDDEHLQEKAMANVVAEYGHTLTADLYIEQCLGRPDEAGFKNLSDIFSALKKAAIYELIDKKVRNYQELIEHASILHPQAKRVIKELNNEFLMAIVTGSSRAEVLPVLAKENIAGYFQSVIAADDITQGKPNPEGYVSGIHALQLPSESIAVIEDIPSGITAAKAAGLKCIAVLHTCPQEDLSQADYIVEDVGKISLRIIREVIAS